jgi:hypothetical protein
MALLPIESYVTVSKILLRQPTLPERSYFEALGHRLSRDRLVRDDEAIE